MASAKRASNGNGRDRREAQILEFRPRKPPGSPRPKPHLVQPPSNPDDDDRIRIRQNVAALVLVILIVVIGACLLVTFKESERIKACFEAGHRNCLPLDIGSDKSTRP